MSSNKITIWLTGAIVLALAAGAARAEPPEPPPFRPDRTAEDYGFLADPALRGDWSDSYKFIPLDGPDSYVSLGGELRERAEHFDAPRFGLGGARDSYLLQRLLLHADVRLGAPIRIFAQLGAYEAVGKTQLAPPDEDHIDMQQLFLELRPAEGLSARLGRQEMILNPTARFVSFRDGTNVRQNFDGARLSLNRGRVRLDAFLTRPVTLERGSFDNNRNRDQMFSGVYASYRLDRTGSAVIDGYWLMLDRDNLVAGPLRGRERRHSIGLRFAGTRGRADWDAEAVVQSGDSIGRDIRAWALSADVGYTLSSAALRPRLGMRVDVGSGDGDPADAVAGGFHPLFPNGPYFNEANLIGWTNLAAVRASLRVQPEPRLTVQAIVQLRSRESVADAVYLGPATPLAATLGNRERDAGEAYSLDAVFQLNRNVALRGYYLHHSAGDAIARAGGDDVDFVMASVTARF